MNKKDDAGMSHSLKYEAFGYLLKNVVDNRGKTCPTADSGIPLIATNCIVNNYLYPLYEKVRYVTEETYKTWFRDHPRPGDMIFVLKGTPGRIAWVPDPIDFCVAQDMVAIRADERKIFPKYLFAVLRSDSIQQEIESLHVGSLIPHFKKGDFNDLIIPIVEPKLQEFIGNQYFDFSVKIDLLHRQNKTLEAMAETLFRQWFVEEADEGWEEGRLGDVIELIYGKGLKKEIRTGTGYPVIGSSGVVGYHSEFLVEGPGIVIGRKGTLGKVIYLWDNFFPIDTTYYIKSKVESAGLLYEYFLLKTLNFEEMNSDSAVPGLNRDIALSTEIKIAPLEKLNKFNQFTSTFIDKLKENTKQIRTLEKLRDTLLPKLMSGEVRIQFGQEATV
nr:type I restriction-modification system, subunit S [uncultured archaeon]CBH40096.1 putative type I restriction-modification system, subunit S [uncultured archaeon]